MKIMKRIFDISFAFFLSLVCAPMILVATFIVLLSDGLPVLYWSKRVGKNKTLFLMPKIRTMKKDTPQLATHLLTNGKSYLIKGGEFLRKSSLDELPQLWSILVGEMSFVGPRPALFNQDDLMLLREKYGVEKIKPGLTGWAQINGRDDISLEHKVELEKYYLDNQSLILDFIIIFKTFFKVLLKKDVSH